MLAPLFFLEKKKKNVVEIIRSGLQVMSPIGSISSDDYRCSACHGPVCESIFEGRIGDGLLVIAGRRGHSHTGLSQQKRSTEQRCSRPDHFG